jgi:hypothetical protein
MWIQIVAVVVVGLVFLVRLVNALYDRPSRELTARRDES